MHAKTRRPEIEEDLAFQHKDWRVQRVGWVALMLVIVAGLAGLLGPGPLSSTTTGGGDAPRVHYERFVRHGGQTDLTVSVTATDGGPLRVAISREYLSALRVQQVLPMPVSVHADGPMLVYTFANPGGAGPVELNYVLQPDELGRHEAVVAAGSGPATAIRQFTYP